jgi:hypothetical protein
LGTPARLTKAASLLRSRSSVANDRRRSEQQANADHLTALIGRLIERLEKGSLAGT